MRKFFSALWHGGSNSDDEARPKPYRDMSTGRTDLQNARPWEPKAP